MKVLVLGDMIYDEYRHFTASRLCPEGPVPVLIDEKRLGTAGGAGLVAEQLTELAGDGASLLLTGSYSKKERVFADDRLMVRMDEDSTTVLDSTTYQQAIEFHLSSYQPDAIIVSDYGKGSFNPELGTWLVQLTNKENIPVFVDAKKNWSWYCGCFAMFPNKEESASYEFVAKHSIYKWGPKGCEVDGVHIPTKDRPVRDCTGAGDTFLAAFVYKYLNTSKTFQDTPYDLQEAAKFANKVAGIGVEYVGTHVVTKAEIDANR